MIWIPKSAESEVPYSQKEYDLYRKDDPSSKYKHVRWPLSKGRGRHGEFPLIVVREHFRNLGYEVLASEPELPDLSGFLLVSYPGKRRKGHPSFIQMERFFSKKCIADLNIAADREKIEKTGNAGGGDPDLFVFNDQECFFVEVKHKDQLNKNQLIAFPLIEKHCNVEIKVARLIGSDLT